MLSFRFMPGDFIILYGSHTGQAEAIAGQIKERAERIGLSPRLHVLNDNEKQFNLEKEKLAIIVISSTGDGDAPENCSRFMRRIHRQTLPLDTLAGVEYALLGLGDSNYSSFQAVPKKLDQRLEALGAQRIVPTGEADDQVGLELTVEPWIENLFKTISSKFNIKPEVLDEILSSKIQFNPVKSKEEKDEIAAQSAMKEEEDEYKVPMLRAHEYEYPELSIRSGNEKLRNDSALRVPVAPEPFLASTVSHKPYKPAADAHEFWQNGFPMVGVVSRPYTVMVVGTALLTAPDAKKPKREIVIDLGEHEKDLPYEPGDAIYFISPNPDNEVNFLLDRCGLLAIADRELTLSVMKETKKIKPVIPGYIPPVSSLRHIFTNCLDIRRAPGRPVLRVLADGAKDEKEKRRLLELCSAQGMDDFVKFIRQAGLSIADLLLAFPSVKPNVDRLIELLPRLMPRPYSVASARGRRVRFVYSVMNFNVDEGRRYPRLGLATEWLMSLKVGDEIQVMAKEPARFRLPPPPLESSCVANMPLIMVGPGTGVAVFLAFCQHLLKLKLANPSEFHHVDRVLYFGCRNTEKDYIYRDELESYVREGILSKLVVCESEHGDSKRYVQDALHSDRDEVARFLGLTEGTASRIFVCGDAKGMSKDVWQKFHEIVEQAMGLSPTDAKAYMLDLKKKDRYIEDVWS